ncbi:MAG: sensor histidine kinase [Candidatus Margulisiibacteriota bacterium]
MLIPISAAYFLQFVDYQFFFAQPHLSGIKEKVIHTCAISTAFLFALLSVHTFYLANKRHIVELSGANDLLKKLNSELLETNQQLAELHKQLDQANEEIMYARLTQRVSHELLNPLYLLTGAFSAIRKQLDDRELLLKGLDIADTTLVKLKDILNTMLFKGKETVEKQPVSLPSILDKIVLLGTATCNRQGIRIERDIETVPTILGQERGLYQLFTNLITNAIQLMPEGGVLSLGCHQTRFMNTDCVEVRVGDTGPGIPKDKQPTLFTSSYTTKNDGFQHGIGLSIVSRIVKDHGADIQIESDPDTAPGTTFILRFRL